MKNCFHWALLENKCLTLNQKEKEGNTPEMETQKEKKRHKTHMAVSVTQCI